jgi:twitching motility two-component system response regulator PilH
MQAFSWKNLFGTKSQSVERRKRPRSKDDPNATVLIVDDSRTVVHALRVMLEQGRYRTLEAGDAEAGIEMAKMYQPDLIIMDILMPGMNGFQATRLLRKDPLTQGIPIIVISGSEQATEQYWSMRLGASDFIAKPIRRGDLFLKVEKYLAQRGQNLPDTAASAQSAGTGL